MMATLLSLFWLPITTRRRRRATRSAAVDLGETWASGVWGAGVFAASFWEGSNA